MLWWDGALRLLAAVAIGCVVGTDRERRHRPAGVRTHMLLCVGAAIVAMLECMLAGEMSQAAAGITFSRGRLSAQVISGIGFLGAGTIFMSQKKVTGLTTAASLWNVACLGLVCGFGYYLLAAVGCLVVMLVLTVMQRVLHNKTTKQVEIRFTQRSETMADIDRYFRQNGILVDNIDFHIENMEGASICTNVYTLAVPAHVSCTEVIRALAEFSDIQSIHTINQ